MRYDVLFHILYDSHKEQLIIFACYCKGKWPVKFHGHRFRHFVWRWTTHLAFCYGQSGSFSTFFLHIDDALLLYLTDMRRLVCYLWEAIIPVKHVSKSQLTQNIFQ